MKGNVFDIQRYSIHDGEGIRTVVFLKGCPLRCKWCSNPESWAPHPEVFYIKSRCIGCRTCVHTCTGGEVEDTPDGILVHHERCTGDLSWVKACPTGALRVKGEWMEDRKVFSEILKDRVFYQRSGGGVTFSGGEPLLQADFVLEVLKMCRASGISTAVETTGDVPWESLEKVRPYVDLFLYDLKALDTQVHRQWTGQGNERVLENLRALAAAGAKIMVRTPLIPGVNDQIEQVRSVIAFLKDIGVQRYNILPFHQYGSGKYESIGIPYSLADLKTHDDSYIDEIRRLIDDEGMSRSYS